MIRPPTPAESALFVKYRSRPAILIFPPQGDADDGQVIIDEEIIDKGLVEVLAVLEWAKRTILEEEEE